MSCGRLSRPRQALGKPASPLLFVVHPSIEYIGGVVSLDARVIANIVIQNVLADMVDDIVEEAESSDTDVTVEFADV